MNKCKYGSKVIIRDKSLLDGCNGVVIKVIDDNLAHILLEREVIWPVKFEHLEPAKD